MRQNKGVNSKIERRDVTYIPHLNINRIKRETLKFNQGSLFFNKFYSSETGLVKVMSSHFFYNENDLCHKG